LASDILLSFIDQQRIKIKETSITISSPWNATAQAIWRSPSSLAIHSANPSYELSKSSIPSTKQQHPFTFVKTAIEANEFPKLIPTTGGSVETTGASALPFGTAFVVIARDMVVDTERERKKFAARAPLRSHVFTLIYQLEAIASEASETNHALQPSWTVDTAKST